MICDECRSAGVLLTIGRPGMAAVAHRNCRGGTWCDCHHSVDPDIVPAAIIPEGRARPAREQAAGGLPPAGQPA